MNNKKSSFSIGFGLYFVWILSVTSSNCLAIQNEANTAAPPKKIEFQCGQHTVAITCGKAFDPDYPEDTRQCNHNMLSFTGPDGKTISPTPPKDFDRRKTPTGMTCAQSNNGKYYVTVELSLGVGSAVQWITFHLFESSGKRVTADLTEHMSEFGKSMKILEIPYTKFIYIEGETK